MGAPGPEGSRGWASVVETKERGRLFWVVGGVVVAVVFGAVCSWVGWL